MPLVVLHNAAALWLGWAAARLMRMDTADRRAVTIEVGMQNSGLGLALILNQFDALGGAALIAAGWGRSEEHTSELQSLMRISYAVFCLKKKKKTTKNKATTSKTQE